MYVIFRTLSSEEVRIGARTAGPICGERCGVGLAQVWGKQISLLGEPTHAANNQGNRERETEREEIQIGRQWRFVSRGPAVGRKVLALAVSVRWHRKEHDLWGLPPCRPQGCSRP